MTPVGAADNPRPGAPTGHVLAGARLGSYDHRAGSAGRSRADGWRCDGLPKRTRQPAQLARIETGVTGLWGPVTPVPANVSAGHPISRPVTSIVTGGTGCPLRL